MTIKSAEPHTIAPRLGYLEDKVDYLASRTGDGGTGTDPSPLLEKLWKATLYGATTHSTFTDKTWVDPPLYSPDRVSLHMTIFGAIYGSQNAQACQDGYGLYGKLFNVSTTHWSPSALLFRPLADDVFFGGPNVGSYRSAGTSLSRSVWHDDASMLGTDRASSIIGRIEALRDDLEQLADNVAAEVARLDARISGMH